LKGKILEDLQSSIASGGW